MRLLITLLFTCCGLHRAIAQQAWSPDNGDGTFTNPILWGDWPDPDVIRVNHRFYMVSTSMHYVPGCPILTSTDLVNWQMAGYAVERYDEDPPLRHAGWPALSLVVRGPHPSVTTAANSMSLSARLMVGEPKRATSPCARPTVLKARGGAPSSRSIFTIRDCSSMTTGGCTWYTASVPALAKHLWPVRAPRDGGGRHLLSRQRTAPRRHGTAEKRRLQLVPLHGQVICIQTAPPRRSLHALYDIHYHRGAIHGI